MNLNVEGRMVTSPIQGFGKMWQKTYRVRLDGIDVPPADMIHVWKTRFPEFWPDGNRFYGPITGIAPGDKEDRFWEHTLRQVAASFGVNADVESSTVCVDSRRQWRRASAG